MVIFALAVEMRVPRLERIVNTATENASGIYSNCVQQSTGTTIVLKLFDRVGKIAGV